MIHTTKARYEFRNECSLPSCSRECILCYFCPPRFKWVCSSSAESEMLQFWESSEVSSYLAQTIGLFWSTELVYVVVSGWIYEERFTGFFFLLELLIWRGERHPRNEMDVLVPSGHCWPMTLLGGRHQGGPAHRGVQRSPGTGKGNLIKFRQSEKSTVK